MEFPSPQSPWLLHYLFWPFYGDGNSFEHSIYLHEMHMYVIACMYDEGQWLSHVFTASKKWNPMPLMARKPTKPHFSIKNLIRKVYWRIKITSYKPYYVVFYGGLLKRLLMILIKNFCYRIFKSGTVVQHMVLFWITYILDFTYEEFSPKKCHVLE